MKKLLLLSPVGIQTLEVAIEKEGEKWYERLHKSTQSSEKPPSWVGPLCLFAWKNNITMFRICRIMGEKQSKSIINTYVKNTSEGIECQDEKDSLSAYMYQILMREGTTEYGIINMFNGYL